MVNKSGTTPLLIHHTDAIVQITLRRPAVANRIQPNDLQILHDFLKECEAMKALRVLILASQGKYFSAGFDLGALDARVKPVKKGERKIDFERFVDAWEKTPLITIAAIQGPIFGGSTDLALASDFRVGTPSVTATMPAAKLGLHLYPGLFRRYVSRLGLNHAKALVLTAASFSHTQLQTMGFLNEIVPEAALNDHVMDMAGQIAQLAPLALSGMKAALNAAAGACLDEDQVRQAMVKAFLSDDFREGITAWREKRTPTFIGS
jgi:enoyl-CoA hydratase